MVADYEVDAALCGIAYLLDGFYAAVEDDDQLYPLTLGIVDARQGDAVAFVVASGDVVFYIGVELSEKLVDERHRSGAVDIVVAVDHDPLLSAHCFVEAPDSLVHVGHEKGIVHVGQRRIEEAVGFVNGRYASLHKELTHRRSAGKTVI